MRGFNVAPDFSSFFNFFLFIKLGRGCGFVGCD